MKTNNWHPKLIKEYLEKYYKNVETRDTCRVYLKLFFTSIGKEPKDFMKLPIKEIQENLFEFARIIENRAKKTQAACISIVKKFLVRNEIDIKEKIWEDLKRRNNLVRATRPITKKETPRASDIKKILSYATGIKSKSLFVFCAQTGLRIDEALSLTFDDIDMDQRKVTLIEKAKFEIPRYTFFTTEAKELIELWKPERKKILQTRYRRSRYVREQLMNQGYAFKKVDKYNKGNRKYFDKNGSPIAYWKIYDKDGKELTKDEIIGMEARIWPFDYIVAQRMWTNLLEKAGSPYNKRDNNPKLQYPRYLYNIHSLRRFWFTQLMFDRANEEYINYMGGHMSELDAAYKFENNVMAERLKEEYDNHMGCLLIFESQPDLSGVHEQLKEKGKQLSNLQQEVHNLRNQLGEFQSLVEDPEFRMKMININRFIW